MSVTVTTVYVILDLEKAVGERVKTKTEREDRQKTAEDISRSKVHVREGKSPGGGEKGGAKRTTDRQGET